MASTDGSEHGRPGTTKAFLEDLASRGREPLLHGVVATVEIDLVNGPTTKTHFARLDDGVVRLVNHPSRIDAVIRADSDIFDGMATGRINSTAAMLRGALAVEGDIGVVASLFRVFPGPSGSPVAPVERSGADE